MKAAHKRERADQHAEHKAGYKDLQKELKGERKEWKRDARREFNDLKKDQAAEVKSLDREHERDRKAEAKDADHTDEDRQRFESERRAEREELIQGHRDDRKSWYGDKRQEWDTLKTEQKQRIKDYRDEAYDDRKSLRETQREERQEFRERLREDIADLRAELFEPEGRSIERKLAIHPRKTSKAFSAGSILRHVLRSKGWSREFRRGELNGEQHLEVLEAIREYARAWLRHEAEQFAEHYLDTTRAIAVDLAAHFGRFFRRAKQFVRETIVAGAMALLGPGPLTGEELNGAEAQAVVQDQFFDRFAGEVLQAPPAVKPEKMPVILELPASMTPAQFIARAEKYGDAPYGAAQTIARQTMINGQIFDQERRVHGLVVDDMCGTCRDQVGKGWQPIGSLLPIGHSECMGNCHCYFEFRNGAKGKPHPVGRRPSPATPTKDQEPQFVFDVNVVMGQ